jgi:hypothetical protein
MKGLLMMLKAFGLKDEDVEKMRVFIPQIPKVAQNIINTFNKAIADFDERLKGLEAGNAKLLERQIEFERKVLEAINESHRLRDIRESDSSGSINGASSGADTHSSGAVTGGRKRGNR